MTSPLPCVPTRRCRGSAWCRSVLSSWRRPSTQRSGPAALSRTETLVGIDVTGGLGGVVPGRHSLPSPLWQGRACGRGLGILLGMVAAIGYLACLVLDGRQGRLSFLIAVHGVLLSGVLPRLEGATLALPSSGTDVCDFGSPAACWDRSSPRRSRPILGIFLSLSLGLVSRWSAACSIIVSCAVCSPHLLLIEAQDD